MNKSLLGEVVQTNWVTTFLQNDKTIRNGKFSLPIKADASVKMVLRNVSKLRMLKYNIKIIPVCLLHEHIFESSFIANEMLSGAFKEQTLLKLLYIIFGMRQGKLDKEFGGNARSFWTWLCEICFTR